MKAKKFGRKLMLNKKTIANLRSEEMNAVLGGVQITDSNPSNCHCPKTILTSCCK